MKLFLKQNKKIITLGIIFGFVFAAGALTPNVSNALFGISLSGIVTTIFKAIAYIFNFIGGIFFAISASLVSFTLTLNMDVARPEMNTIADIGWRISRDIANLGFVLLTVIMAFTTIIRVQSYGAKKLLLNLIIAAIVVNFSFVIAGTLIDFSNTLTYFFIGRISPGGLGTGFTEVLANAFGPQKFLLEESDDPIPPDPSQEESGLVTFGVAVLSSIAGLFFIVFFTFLAVIVLLMLAIMFLVRYVALTFLLVLAPLAWLFWVFPGLKSYNGQWWSAFWKYTFFAPAASFFVYLSLVAAENLSQTQYQEKISAAIGGGLPGMLGKIAQQGTQMIVVAGLMIGAITVAQKMGIEGASIANKAKDGLIKGAKTYGKNRANAIGTKLAQNKYLGGAISRFGLSGKKLKGTGEDVQKQREAARARKLEYEDQKTAIKNSDLSSERKTERLKALDRLHDTKERKYQEELKKVKEDKDLSKEDKKKKIQELEKTRGGRMGLGSKIGLWAKDKTFGSAARSVGGGIESTGKAVDKQAQKKIEGGGWNKNLMKGAGEGVGLFKKAEKKDEQKTVSELEKDHGKLLKEKADMLAMRGPDGLARFKEEDLKDLNKKIEFSENKLVAAKAAKNRSMTKEELESELGKVLEDEKKGGGKDKQNLVRRNKENLEKSINAKNREEYTTSGQISDAINEVKKSVDKDIMNDLDPTIHQNILESLEKQKEKIEGRLGSTAKAFNKIEEGLEKLTKERGEKLKELKQSNPDFSDDDIRNHETVKAIDEKIDSQKKQISGWKEVLGQGKYTEATINKRIEALGQIKNELGGDESSEQIKQELSEKQEKMGKDLEEIRKKQKNKGQNQKGGGKHWGGMSQETLIDQGSIPGADNS